MRHHDWLFRLYIAGHTPLAERTLNNLQALVDHHLPDGATIDVVNLKENPGVAVSARILAVPTVVRERPEPEARLIGDLSDQDEARKVLNLPPRERQEEK